MKQAEFNNNKPRFVVEHMTTRRDTVNGRIVNMRLFEHNFTWLNGGKFNLDIIRTDSNVHDITQTVLERYDKDTDTYHMIVNEFNVIGLCEKIIEILRMGLQDPKDTIELVNAIRDFEKL